MQELFVKTNLPEKTLRDIFYVLFRHKRKMLLFFLTVMVTVTLGTISISKIYKSDAKLMIRLGRESVTLDPTAAIGQIVNIDRDRVGEINSELEIITSQELAEKVVDAIGVETLQTGYTESDSPAAKLTHNLKKITKFPFVVLGKLINFMRYIGVSEKIKQLQERDRVIKSLIEDIKVEVVEKSNIILLSYEDKSPQLAHNVLAKLIDFYLDKHMSLHRNSGSFQFFIEQKEKLQKAIEQLDNNIKTFKNTTGFSSLEEQRTISLEMIGDLQREIQKTESDLTASLAQIKTLESALSGLPKELITEKTTGIPLSSKEELRKRLHDLRLEEQRLLTTFTEDSIPVIEIRRQVREVQSLLDEEADKDQVTKGINVSHQQIQLTLMTEKGVLSALQAKTETLRDQLSKAQDELKILNSIEGQLDQMQREKEILETNYQKYSESLEQARIDNELEADKISNVSIVQPATLPVKHDRPRKLLNLAIGLFVGIFGAIALGFCVEYLDHSFKRPEDIDERLNLPTLVSIPFFEQQNGLVPDMSTIKNLIKVPKNGANADKKAISGRDLSSEIQKYFEILLHRVLFLDRESPEAPHIFAVTSCRYGEGVSTVAANLAVKLSRLGNGHVLLADMNLLNSNHQDSGEKVPYPYSNLGNIMALRKGSNSNSLQSRVDELYMLQYSKQEKSTELVELQSFWRKEYEFVVMDMPAVLDDARVATLARLADEVILVIEAERVKWEVAQRAKDRLMQAGSDLIGVVFNKRRFYIPEWFYKTLS